MPERTGRFRRSDRLRDPRDYRRVSRSGRRFASREFVVLVSAQFEGTGPPRRRLGISASRKVGNAVVRNRVKRGVREWFRARRHLLAAGLDFVVIARPDAARLSCGEMSGCLDALTRRLDEAGSGQRGAGR